MCAERAQQVRRDHQLDPDRQPASLDGSLVGGELDRAVADQAAADTGLDHAGHALGEAGARRCGDRLHEVVDGVGLAQCPHGRHPGFGEHPVVMCGSSGQLAENGTVDDASVPGVMDDEQHAPGGDGVQLGCGEMAAERALVVADDVHPGPRWALAGGRADRGEHVADVTAGGHAGAAGPKASPGQVHVCIDEAGHRGSALQVHHPSRRQCCGGVVQRDDAAPPDADLVRHRMARVHGVHGRTGQPQIQHRQRRSVPRV